MDILEDALVDSTGNRLCVLRQECYPDMGGDTLFRGHVDMSRCALREVLK